MAQPVATRPSVKRSSRNVIVAIIIIVAMLIGWFVVSAISADLEEQGQVSTRDSILNAAKQCCAVEGSYPTSLAYLEENYGLVVNHTRYLITYDVFAENVMPNVVVLAK